MTKAKTTRIEKEALYNQLKAVQGTSGRSTASRRCSRNDYIQKIKSDLGDLQRQQAQLAEKYGDRHPEMIKIRTAMQSTEAKLENEIEQGRRVGAEPSTRPRWRRRAAWPARSKRRRARRSA